MTPGTNWNAGDDYLARVKRAYRAAIRSEVQAKLSVWGEINDKQADVHIALMENDHAALREIFANPASTDLFFGVDNLSRSVVDKMNEEGLITQARDLSRQIPYERFVFPNPFPREMGYETPTGLVSYRAALAASQALKVFELAGNRGSVVEIGPGLGRVALHARQLGITDYTTVDRALGLVAQACFLGATLGPDAIWFSTDSFPSKGRVRVLTYRDLATERRHYDVVLNADSLPEMPPLTALRYGMWIRKNANYFLSINHHMRRLKVWHLAALCFPLSRVAKRPYDLREGYFEELFQIGRSRDSLS